MVVPSSVLDNWASELGKFCPALYLVKYHGSQKDRLALRHSLNRVSSGQAKEDMPVSERETDRESSVTEVTMKRHDMKRNVCRTHGWMDGWW